MRLKHSIDKSRLHLRSSIPRRSLEEEERADRFPMKCENVISIPLTMIRDIQCIRVIKIASLVACAPFTEMVDPSVPNIKQRHAISRIICTFVPLFSFPVYRLRVRLLIN